MDVRHGKPSGDILKVTRFSRRQFFHRLGIGLGGAAVGGIALASACKAGITSPVPSEADTSTTTEPPSTTPAATTPVNSTAQTTIPLTSATTDTNTPVNTLLPYKPSPILPKLIRVGDTECTIATDRSYSVDHIWVKSLSSDLVVMGISSTMVTLIYQPYTMRLFEAGTTLVQYDAFGEIEGYKTSAELVTPVSGKLVERNEYLVQQGKSGWGGGMPLLETEPYIGGWMIVVKLAKPDELKELVSPEVYLERLLKIK